MLHAIGTPAVYLFEREQGQLTRTRQIAFTVFVVNGEGLDRKLPQLAESGEAAHALRLGQVQDIPPHHRRFGITALAPVSKP